MTSRSSQELGRSRDGAGTEQAQESESGDNKLSPGRNSKVLRVTLPARSPIGDNREKTIKKAIPSRPSFSPVASAPASRTCDEIVKVRPLPFASSVGVALFVVDAAFSCGRRWRCHRAAAAGTPPPWKTLRRGGWALLPAQIEGEGGARRVSGTAMGCRCGRGE